MRLAEIRRGRATQESVVKLPAGATGKSIAAVVRANLRSGRPVKTAELGSAASRNDCPHLDRSTPEWDAARASGTIRLRSVTTWQSR